MQRNVLPQHKIACFFVSMSNGSKRSDKISRKFTDFSVFRNLFLTTFAKRLHIGKIFPSADDRTQAYDYDILQLMPDISVSGSSRLLDIFDFFFKSKCCCPGVVMSYLFRNCRDV